MNHMNLVEILMDVSRWTSVFSSIVSRAITLEVLSTGVSGNYNGALPVMSAEFQVPSPIVPTRENYFIRYCKQHGDGTWAVVDVSLDNLRPTFVSRSRRRPSGCLIQELPNGYSKVTWIEHVEVDDKSVHSIYKALVNSGLAFGAIRSVAILDRQCERLASVMANNISTGDVGVGPNGVMRSIKPQPITFIVPGLENLDHTEISNFVQKAQENLEPALLEFAWIELLEKNKSTTVEELAEMIFGSAEPLESYSAHMLLAKDVIYFTTLDTKGSYSIYGPRPAVQVGHWVVVAIDMVTRKIYHLDPLPDGRPDEKLKRMVNDFSECHDFNMDDLSRLRDERAAYVAKLIVAHNNQASRLKEKATVGQKHG
ncbi:hypothetical protein OROGR_028180 [Orobanche gracilis]